MVGAPCLPSPGHWVKGLGAKARTDPVPGWLVEMCWMDWVCKASRKLGTVTGKWSLDWAHHRHSTHVATEHTALAPALATDV